MIPATSDLRVLLGTDWTTTYEADVALYRFVHARGLAFTASTPVFETGAARVIADAVLDAVMDHVKGEVVVTARRVEGKFLVTIEPTSKARR